MNKKKFFLEHGRSMVEMLGVLAIVGILALGGIALYTIAMNKYKANEILSEAEKCAAAVAAQIATGGKGVRDINTHIPMFECDGEDIEMFGTVVGTEVAWESHKISITVEDVPTTICQYMRSAVDDGPNGVMIINEFCPEDKNASINLHILFNEDMAPNVRTIFCGTSGNICAGCQTCQDGICKDNNTKCHAGSCNNGVCVCGSGLLEACGNTCCGKDDEGRQLVCKNKGTGETADQFECFLPDEEEGKCRSNEDCGEGEFCDLAGGGSDVCWPEAGYCLPLTNPAKVGYINGRKVYSIKRYGADNPQRGNQGYASWWGAQNDCLARGKRMASLADLGMEGNYGSCVEKHDPHDQEYCHEYWLAPADTIPKLVKYLNEGGTWSDDLCSRDNIVCDSNTGIKAAGLGAGSKIQRRCLESCCKSPREARDCNPGDCNEVQTWLAKKDDDENLVNAGKINTRTKTLDDGTTVEMPQFCTGGWRQKGANEICVGHYSSTDPTVDTGSHTCDIDIKDNRLRKAIADGWYWTASLSDGGNGCFPYTINASASGSSIGSTVWHSKGMRTAQVLCVDP